MSPVGIAGSSIWTGVYHTDLELGNAKQQSAAFEGQLELVPNAPSGWRTDSKMYRLVPTFGCQMMAEITK